MVEWIGGECKIEIEGIACLSFLRPTSSQRLAVPTFVLLAISRLNILAERIASISQVPARISSEPRWIVQVLRGSRSYTGASVIKKVTRRMAISAPKSTNDADGGGSAAASR
jgi:hypothetical protein